MQIVEVLPESARWRGELEDAALELRLRQWALPVALAAASLLLTTSVGQFLLRIFFGMWVHEVGHAAAAWLCGFPAFPGPWLTPVASQRSLFFALFLAAGLGYWSYRNWRSERRALLAASVGLLGLQFVGTILLSAATARMVIVFAGDGGCLILGSLLMASVYAPEGSVLHRGWLRWGLLVIGAAAFVDVFEQWWASRRDVDRIPFGMNEGAGLSDPSVLSETYHWSTNELVSRCVALGCACLVALLALYVFGWMRARARLRG
ncbi:MAG TPA: hypothetical protein VE782_09230 [Myxococcaceae bacterium]|nr:hypothetical protein [Myxococcaceae bacterium]